VLEILSLESPSVILSKLSFKIEDIKQLELSFNESISSTFIQKVIDNEVRFDRDSLSYMMSINSQRRVDVDIVNIEEDTKELFVIGDIHADAVSLKQILLKTNFYEECTNKKLLFLGDYVDRGKNRLNVINLLITLEFLLPENIVILKGNHELSLRDENGVLKSPMKGSDNLSYFFTFLNFLSNNEDYKELFPSEFIEDYATYFNNLPTVAMLSFEDIKIMAMHGGLPRADLHVRNYYEAYETIDSFFQEDKQDIIGMSLKNNFLWSDPYDGVDEGFRHSSMHRFKFDKKQFISFCRQFDVDMVLRAHEAQDDGYKTYFDNRLVSVFSTGGKDIKGNLNENSHYSTVAPNILKLNLEIKIVESYEILFNEEDMICEESFTFEDIKLQRVKQEEEYIEYIPKIENLISSPKKLLNDFKLLKITDIFNKYTVKTIPILQNETIKLTYKELNDFFGIDINTEILIDTEKNIIINFSDKTLFVDRFELSKGESLPFSTGNYKFQSGANLIFELI